jgi:CHAD domain-containing protein
MSVTYALKPDEAVGPGVRRIVFELLDSIMDDLEHLDSDRDERIHSARQQLKKLRGLLRLVRGSIDPAAYERENACFRDVGRSLADAREAAAALECVDILLEHYSGEIPRNEFRDLEHWLKTHHGSKLSRAREDAVFEHAVLELRRARERMTEWPLVDDDFDSLGQGLFFTYRRARRALRRAASEPTSQQFHELRKLSKYHLYHVRMLEAAFPNELRARRKALDALNDTLGHLHDLDVLRQMLVTEKPEAAPRLQLLALTALVDRRRHELAVEAELQGAPIYAEKPRALLKRARRYFALWRTRDALETDLRGNAAGTGALPLAVPASAQAKRSITV